VTGGAGFVGTHLAMGARAHFGDVRVIALDNLKRRGSELNVPRLRAADVEFLHGDIRQPADLEEAGPVDVLIECSAEPSVLAGHDGSPDYVVHTNLTGALHCLEYARKHGAGLIFLSTSRVYPMETIAGLSYRENATRFELEAAQSVPGVSEHGFSEAFPLEGVRSLYGATKLCSELILQEYAAMYGLRSVVNRCGVITGPGQMGKVDQGVAVLWMARHIYGGPLKYIGYGGQGKQVRDLLHVNDLARLILHEIEHLDALSGQTFNVGGGPAVSVSLCEMTAICEALAGTHLEIGSEPSNRPADIPLYLSDGRKVSAATGWRPEWTISRIFEDIANWIQSNKEMLRPFLDAAL